MKEPIISVIVPVYKAADYLPQCVESIISQGGKNFELLLINDGSPDQSGQICDEYLKKDSRIRVFHKTNGGVSSARNLGLDNARGEWICFVDADDYMIAEALPILIDKTAHHDADVICFNNHFVDDNGKVSNIVKNTGSDDEINVYEDIRKRLRCLMHSPPWGKLYKRKALAGIKFDESIHIAEDLLFHITVLLSKPSIKVLNCQEFLYYYRIWEGSAMAKADHDYKLLHDKLKVVLSNAGVFNLFEPEYNAFLFINIYNKIINPNHIGMDKTEYMQFLPIIRNAYKVGRRLKATNRIAVLFYKVNRYVGNIYIRLFCFFKSTVSAR